MSEIQCDDHVVYDRRTGSIIHTRYLVLKNSNPLGTSKRKKICKQGLIIYLFPEFGKTKSETPLRILRSRMELPVLAKFLRRCAPTANQLFATIYPGTRYQGPQSRFGDNLLEI